MRRRSLPITVAGSANMDLVFRGQRLPGPGETVPAGSFTEVPGGKGANQAVAAARLGGNVAFFGRVGNDNYGRILVEGLKRQGIDVSGVMIDRSERTGRAAIVVDDAGRNMISVFAGANGRVKSTDVPVRRLRKGILLLQLEIPAESVAGILAKTGPEVFVILNPAPAAPLSAKILRRVDLLVPNEYEAAMLTGRKDPVIAGRRLLRLGARNVLVTLGAQGAVVIGKAKLIAVPAFRVKAVDATAAGDTFCGALAARLAEGEEVETAIPFASAAAALAVTRPGAQPSIPALREATEFLGSQLRC